jgi:hypothetical protein
MWQVGNRNQVALQVMVTLDLWGTIIVTTQTTAKRRTARVNLIIVRQGARFQSARFGGGYFNVTIRESNADRSR